jgi:hypothetical protein
LENFFDIYNEYGVIRRSDIAYLPIIRKVKECFDKAPFVFTLEELREDLDALLSKLGNLFGEAAPDMTWFRGLVRNEGVKYWQGKLLRMLNRIDKKPGTTLKPKGLLRLTNTITQELGLDPRGLSQVRLRNISNRPIEFKAAVKNSIEQYYQKDWEGVLRYIDENRLR